MLLEIYIFYFKNIILQGCLALSSGASFGEIRELATQLGYGQGRESAYARLANPPQVDALAYLSLNQAQQQPSMTMNGIGQNLGTNPMAGFDFLKQLSAGGGMGSKFGGMGMGMGMGSMANKFGGLSGMGGYGGMLGGGMFGGRGY